MWGRLGRHILVQLGTLAPLAERPGPGPREELAKQHVSYAHVGLRVAHVERAKCVRSWTLSDIADRCAAHVLRKALRTFCTSAHQRVPVGAPDSSAWICWFRSFHTLSSRAGHPCQCKGAQCASAKHVLSREPCVLADA